MQCPKLSDTQIQRYVKVSSSESALEAAVAQRPVSAAIQGLKGPFKFYKGGVLQGQCGDALDHGLLIVGFGVDEETGLEYWRVKNDFGTGFGEDGFARLEKGIGGKGMCGIASVATYPLL